MADGNGKRRRTLRLRGFDYARFGPFFVPICAEHRACLFGAVVDGEMQLDSFGRIVEEERSRTAALRPETILDAHVVMPNHFHGIVSILNAETAALGAVEAHSGAPLRWQSRSLGSLIVQFKAATTKRINLLRRCPGTPAWQRNYYEHVVRDERDLERIRYYIAANPSKWDADGYHPANLAGRGQKARSAPPRAQ